MSRAHPANPCVNSPLHTYVCTAGGRDVYRYHGAKPKRPIYHITTETARGYMTYGIDTIERHAFSDYEPMWQTILAAIKLTGL